jgi:hypothetical protein
MKNNNSAFTCESPHKIESIKDLKFFLDMLYDLDLENPDSNLVESMKMLQDVLIFILETVEWKVGD